MGGGRWRARLAAGAGGRREAGALRLQHRPPARHRRLLHLRDRAGAVLDPHAPRAVARGPADRLHRRACQRLWLLPDRRQDARSLLHGLPLVLEHRGVLPLRAGMAARAECRDRDRVRDRRLRAGALHLSLAHADAAGGDGVAPDGVGRRGPLRARPPGVGTARARGGLAPLPGVLLRALVRAPRPEPARVTDLARLAMGTVERPELAPAPVRLAADELAGYLARMFGWRPQIRGRRGAPGAWLHVVAA